MTRNERRGLSLVSAFVILSTLWFAAPHASQEGANEGFILFSVGSGDTPVQAGSAATAKTSTSCRRTARHPTRITDRCLSDGQRPPSGRTARSSIAFHSNREWPTRDLPDEPRRQRPAPPREPRRRRERSFPASPTTATSSVSTASTTPEGHLHREHSRDGADEPDQPLTGDDNLRCDWSPKGNDIAFGSTARRQRGDLRHERGRIGDR